MMMIELFPAQHSGVGEAASSHQDTTRNMSVSLQRSIRCRCPACGEGKLFTGYLKVTDKCATCSEEMHHHRADDLPPYIVITIVGHIIVALMLMLDLSEHFSMMSQILLWSALTLILSFALMRPTKGAVVGYQWALRLHGFEAPQEYKTTTLATQEK